MWRICAFNPRGMRFDPIVVVHRYILSHMYYLAISLLKESHRWRSHCSLSECVSASVEYNMRLSFGYGTEFLHFLMTRHSIKDGVLIELGLFGLDRDY